jgi:hypothetical protein
MANGILNAFRISIYALPLWPKSRMGKMSIRVCLGERFANDLHGSEDSGAAESPKTRAG